MNIQNKKSFEEWYKENYDPNGYLYPSAPLNIGFQDYCTRVEEYLEWFINVNGMCQKQYNNSELDDRLIEQRCKLVLKYLFPDYERMMTVRQYNNAMQALKSIAFYDKIKK